jgi:hypothetical protein
MAIGRKRDRGALHHGIADSAGADQLGLLGPDPIAAGEDPSRPDAIIVDRPAGDGGVAVGGKRNGGALPGSSNSAGADQLGLLGPGGMVKGSRAAGEDPRRPDERAACSVAVSVVPGPANESGIAIGRRRDEPLSGEVRATPGLER